MGTATNSEEMWQRAKKAGRAKNDKADRKINQQINFWLMREIWNTIRGRAKKDMVENRTIYDVLKISRERYTRALDGQGIRLSKDEIMTLVKKTGVQAGIFEGTSCFRIEKISRDDWKDLFALRINDNTGTGNSIKEFKKKGKVLFSRIQKSDLDRDKNLHNFSVYLKFGLGNSTVTIEQAVKESIERLNGRNFDSLEDCNIETLEEYLRSLEAQVEKVATLVKYKKFKK